MDGEPIEGRRGREKEKEEETEDEKYINCCVCIGFSAS